MKGTDRKVTATEARHIHVRGIVQGVGMRPFVYRLAVERGPPAWVRNASDGVHIEVVGEPWLLDDFQRAIVRDAPPAARIEDITVIARSAAHTLESVQVSRRDVAIHFPESPQALSETLVALSSNTSSRFQILTSDEERAVSALVSHDLATCDACLHELHNPQDRRYHYPFINCTNCGPRFTIIDRLPYDRPATSMASFTMCASCDDEYHDPI
ncbi:MAG: acylphosphatase, partial [Coriobacteriia bacterium]|nr:acylphosphatase [Coriobacteriia bacterium]